MRGKAADLRRSQGPGEEDRYAEAVAKIETLWHGECFTRGRTAVWGHVVAVRRDVWGPGLPPQAAPYGNSDALSSPQVSGKMYNYGPNKTRGRQMMAASPGT